MNYLFSKFIYLPLTETFKNCTITYHKVIIIAIFQDGKNGIYLYFVNKHLSGWALLGLLTHYQTTNFRLVQIETVCRRQF